MTIRDKIHEAIERIKPKLENRAEGHVELIDVDDEKGLVKVKLIGGRLC